MNANKLFSEFSLKKIWDKLSQHDKAMNSTILVLPSGNWSEQEDGTFKNTVSYKGFTENDKLTVDLYDDGNLSETQLNEYEQYIDSFETVNGALVATANTKPTRTMTVVVKGDFEVVIKDMSEITTELNTRIDECFQSVSNGKELLASAITDMEVPTDATATFEEMANNIRSIESGVDISDTTAVASQVSLGFIFYDANGNRCEGTRPLPVGSLSGSFSASNLSDGADYPKNITFSTPFDTIPAVTASISVNWYDGGGNFNHSGVDGVDKVYVVVSNVSRTGCTITLQCRPHYNLTANVSCTWRATTG